MDDVLHSISRSGPIALSAITFSVVVVVLTTGWQRWLTDEGTAAHIWQLLMILQVPLVALFLATANWRRPKDVAKTLALQAVAFGVAAAPVALFKL